MIQINREDGDGQSLVIFTDEIKDISFLALLTKHEVNKAGSSVGMTSVQCEKVFDLMMSYTELIFDEENKKLFKKSYKRESARKHYTNPDNYSSGSELNELDGTIEEVDSVFNSMVGEYQ